MRARLAGFFERIWYGRSRFALLFVPFSWVYAALFAMHRARAKARIETLPVPVIVVGNLTVGGTGKTPIVAWLVEQLRAHGMAPGVVTRGYAGDASQVPVTVGIDTPARAAGDEALMLARRLRCPVVACPDRVAAARALIATESVDVIVSDDGLQHFALRADCEIIVIDGERGMGNGRLLPAGPLRESVARLANAHVVLVNGAGWTCPGAHRFELQCTDVEQLSDGQRCLLHDFSGRAVHAAAAIGNPARFFAMLRQAGCTVDEHTWPDHAEIPVENLLFTDAAPVLVTQKDAVKLPPKVRSGVWSVNVDASLSVASATSVLNTVLRRIGRDTESR